MQIALTLVPAAAPATGIDVEVDAATGTPLGAVAAELRQAAGDCAGADLYAGPMRLAESTPLGSPGLRSGCRVGVGAPVDRGPSSPALVELSVVGGPDAGTTHPLRRGRVVVGRDDTADVVVADPDLSRRHLALQIGSDAVRVADLGSTNGTRRDGCPLGAGLTDLPAGASLRAGESTLRIGAPERRQAACRPRDDGTVVVNRPPRITPAGPRSTVRFPTPPDRRSAGRLPVIAALAPLVMGVGMAVVTHSPQYLAFAVLSPVMLVGNAISERLGLRKGRRHEATAYRRDLADATAALAEALAASRRRTHAAAPDPATIARTALTPSHRLWERRRADADFLRVRIGTGDRPADVAVEGPVDATALTARQVPVSIDLAGTVGVAGPRPPVDALVRSLVCQLGCLHGPSDLQIAMLGEQGAAARWEWARWLPHIGGPGAPAAAFGPGPVAALAGDLAAAVERRAAGIDRDRGPWTGERLVVVLDCAAALVPTPALLALLRTGPSVGVHAVCIERSALRLPAECRTTIDVSGETGTRVRLRSTDAEGVVDIIEDVVADCVGTSVADSVARALAPLTDGADGAATSPPRSSRLLPLLQLQSPTAEDIRRGWAAGGKTTEFTIGEQATGPMTIDLAKDGPHALVAGTTGAGKSELLQTIIASLAVTNRPDAMTFVLIDYKGGAAFKDCATLPHTVGMVTDLDGHLTERALASLNAELKRREHILATAGAKDIDDYWALIDGPTVPDLIDGPTVPASTPDPMPRCILIIDEFASLVEELPDFVTGLVGIAMRGRSLGVHLILATQRPSGVVSPVIRANTNLRIALRVTDTAESTDVIDAPDAARIPKGQAGRGYARTGADAPIQFQTARVGGRATGRDDTESRVARLCWPPAGGERAGSGDPGETTTDLRQLVAAIRAATRIAPRSPWLPPLPEIVTLSTLAEQSAEAGPVAAPDALPYALADRPDEQRRAGVAVDITTGGSLLVVGGARSGRSTTLRTIVGAGAIRYRPDELHFYLLDCAGGALLATAGLPHCAAYCGRDDVARGDRVLARLSEEIARRQALLACDGFASVAEQHAATPAHRRLPWILLVLDGWEGFAGAYESVDAGRPIETFQRLAREGAAAGVRVVVAGDRATLTGRIASCLPTRLVLRLADAGDYALAGLRAADLPAPMGAGRGVLADGAVEVQVALLDGDPSGAGQTAALTEIARRCTAAAADLDPARLPARLRPLPRTVSLDALTVPPTAGPLWTPIGIGGDDGMTLGVDLAVDGPGLLVAGPARSGRSAALRTMAAGLLAGGTDVALLLPRRSPLRDLAGAPGVLGVFGPTDADGLADATAVGPVAVLVDDAETFTDSPAAAVLVERLRSDDGRLGVIAAGRAEDLAMSFRGLAPAVRSSRSGVLLQPRYSDGDLLGVRLPRTTAEPLPGRGILVVAGTTTPIQVALPPEAAQTGPARPRGSIGAAAVTLAGRLPAGGPVSPCGGSGDRPAARTSP